MDKINRDISSDRYDLNAWGQLINESHSSGNPDLIRDSYERVLAVYPSSVQHWAEYIEYEIKQNHLDKAEALFTRSTSTLCSLSIFKLYLQYIKRSNSLRDGAPRGPSERKVISQAYEFVLLRVGCDREAGPLWLDYIALLKTTESHNSWEQQQSVEKIRRVYTQAISIPTLALEQIWKDYEHFETSLNRVAAKKYLTERSTSYNNAKNGLKELKVLTDPLKTSTKLPARPPTWNTNEIKLVENWRAYLTWEKSNPLQYEAKDYLYSRLVFAYNQALIGMRFYPEFWVDFASFYERSGKIKEAHALYLAGSKALPTSLLLNCAYAEFEEKQKSVKESHGVYSELIKVLTQELVDLQSSFANKLSELDSSANKALDKAGQGSREIDGEIKEILRKKEKVKEKQRLEIESVRDAEVDKIKRKITLVWVNYMKSARRIEGLRGLRRVFGEARKAGNVTYHLFVDSAMMEYYTQDDPKIPENIFQFGQRFFSKEPGYILQYLDFLMKKKDTNNTRALFERSIENIPKEHALELWEKIAAYEYGFGDISKLQKIEGRIFNAYSLISASGLFAERISYLDIKASSELGPMPKLNESIISVAKAENSNIEDNPSNQSAFRKTLLDSVSSTDYVRPDFSKWASFKPSNDGPRNPQPLPLVPTALLNQNSPQVSGSGTPGHVPQAVQNIIPMGGLIPNQVFDIPQAVSYFLSQIPPASDFQGPMIPCDQIMRLLSDSAPNFPPPEELGMANININAQLHPSQYMQFRGDAKRPGPQNGVPQQISDGIDFNNFAQKRSRHM